MRIVQVTHAKFPPAIRVLKNARSYKNLGHSSIVIAPRYEGQSSYEVFEGVEIYRPEIFERSVFSLFFERAFFFSAKWTSVLRRLFAVLEVDVVHCHDVWLSKICYSSMNGQKFILDLHENMPAAVEEYLKSYSGIDYLFRFFFHRRWRIFKLESLALRRSDAILVVVQEARNRVLREHVSIQPDKVYIVENFESMLFGEIPTNEELSRNQVFTFLYIGGFGPHRGLETLVQAATKVVETFGIDLVLNLVGAVPSKYLEGLQKLIEEQGCSRYVNVIGWVSSDEVSSYIRSADVCCIPHFSTPHTDNTIPHKLYQYMALRKPILVSSSAPLSRVIEESGAGVVFEAGSVFSCANIMRDLIALQHDLNLMGENGYSYVSDKGNNWEENSERVLFNVLNDL